MITWDDVVAIAPELSDVVTAGQTAILAAVAGQVDDGDACSPWAGSSYLTPARQYLAAHLGTLTRSRGKGPITEERVGQLQRSYGDMTAIAGTLGLTSYGVEYQRLVRLTTAGLGAVW